MRFSDRVRSIPPSTTLAVSAKTKLMQAAGIDVIGFGAGEPDFDTPENIKQAAIDALGRGMTGYQAVQGEINARQTIAKKLRDENGIDCSADDICISTGGKQSLYLALQCLLDPPTAGTSAFEVVLPTPAWVSYAPMVQLAGGRIVEVPGSVDTDFRITADQLAAAITDQSRVFIVNSPSNPCGTMYSPDQLRELAAVLAEHPQITIISDEIYEKLIYGDTSHFSMGSVPALADRVVTINGLSKAYAMTGWRIGYACGPGGLAIQMAKLQSQMTSCITSFCYPAIVEALTSTTEPVETMRAAFAERATLIHDCVSRWPGVRCPKPTGAFYVFPDISAAYGKTTSKGRAITNATTLVDALLEEAHIAVVPGHDFGADFGGHIRLSFATSPEKIRSGCERIEQWMNALT